MKKRFFILIIITILIIGINLSAVFAVNTIGNNSIDASLTEQTQNLQNVSTQNANNGLGLIAVALATGLACIGAGIAVATVGASSVGAISENPKLLGKTIIFAGLAEGIAIYGLPFTQVFLPKNSPII